MRWAVRRLKWTVSDTLMRTRWMDSLQHVGLFFRKMLSLFPVWNICYLLETSSHTKTCFSYLGPTGTECSEGQRSALVESNAYFLLKDTPVSSKEESVFTDNRQRDLINISLSEQYLPPLKQQTDVWWKVMKRMLTHHFPFAHVWFGSKGQCQCQQAQPPPWPQ